MDLLELDLARNGFGKPLDPDCRRRLEALLENPCEATWDDAHGIVLSPYDDFGTTVWKAVLAVDPTYPAVGPSWKLDPKTGLRTTGRRWTRVPDRGLLLRALRYATH